MGSCQSSEIGGEVEVGIHEAGGVPIPKSGLAEKNESISHVVTSPDNCIDHITTSSPLHSPNYASECSKAPDCRSLDSSHHGRDRINSATNVKSLGGVHSSSVLGLDLMMEARKEEGDLLSNVVHIEVPFGKPIEEVYDGVHNGPVLGSGISGLVRLVTHKATSIKYAVKCLDVGQVNSAEGLQQLREEIFIMCQLDHPNIVRLEEVYESHSEIYLVQELCLGGELFDRLDEQPDYHYTEAECAKLVKQMLCAVRYLHSKGIIHRDLKLENFLFSSTSQDSELKMIDFGLSKHFNFGEVHNDAVGTPYTVAPEVIRGKYDERCDIWAIGVITYLLLSGDPPFGGCGGPEPLMTVRSNILAGFFEFEPEEIWSIVSSQAREFIMKLLVTEPKLRPTAKDAQQHAWLQEWATRSMTENDNTLNPNVVKALVSFKEFSDMRKLLCEVLSFTLLPDQIKDLRKEFEKMDTDGSGEISLEALKQVLMTNACAGSLGALTETEVEDIFNAMRVRKTETRIHWHEFIAAGLSQCQVDERNVRLAFDRLDSDHKGYITFENVMDLMGNDAFQSKDAMRTMWGDSMRACNCHHARITYDDFLLLMKGQTRDTTDHITDVQQKMQVLHVVHEAKTSEEEEDITEEDITEEDITEEDITEEDTTSIDRENLKRSISDSQQNINCWTNSDALLAAPLCNKTIINQIPDIDQPLSMDDEFLVVLTPPESPKRGAMDDVTPHSARKGVSFSGDTLVKLPELPKKLSITTRKRSRSVDDQDPEVEDGETPSFGADARRAMLLPEHDHNQDAIGNLIKDETKTALVVNRQLYRAHRQMRQAVLDATKRFEEQQAIRAREILMAQRDTEGTVSDVTHVGAGLVLRHGLKKQVSSEAVGNWLKKIEEEQAELVQKANKRGGRGKSRRKKTISDMSGMLTGMCSELKNECSSNLGGIDVCETAKNQLSSTRMSGMNTTPDLSDVSVMDDFPPLRNATVPGVFRRTRDPFGEGGWYG